MKPIKFALIITVTLSPHSRQLKIACGMVGLKHLFLL